MDNPKRLQARIVSGSVVLLLGTSLTNAINLGYNVAVARFLGPKGFGHATAVYTLLTLISAVTLSFQIISAKLVAQQGSAEGKSAVYRDFHKGAWGCGVLAALLLVLFQRGIADYLRLPSPALVVLIAVGIAFYVPLGSRRGYIQGTCGFRGLATNLVLEGAARLVGSLFAVMLGFGVTGVIVANAAAVAVAYLAIAPRLAPAVLNPLSFRYALREISLALVFFAGLVLINNCDIVLVKHFFTPVAAGFYAAVAMVGRVIFALSSAVVNSMFPVVAGTRDEERKGFSLIATSLLLVLAIGSILALGLRLTPAWIWTSIFGPGFQLRGHAGFPSLLALYAITTVIYSLSVVIITYEMSHKIANAGWLQLLFSGMVIAGICRFHSSLEQVIVVQLVLMTVLLILVGTMFFAETLRNRGPLPEIESSSIRLIRRVSEDEVIAEFLKSDFENVAYLKYQETLRTIAFKPDFKNQSERAMRRALLFLRHRSLWKEIPSETEWYEAEIRKDDFSYIQVFPRAHWRKIANGNLGVTGIVNRMRNWQEKTGNIFLIKIAGIRNRLLHEESMPGSVLLIGVDQTKPLTILDGNHRFIAAALEDKIHQLRFFCGLSLEMKQCCWYRTNPLTIARYGGNLLRQVIHHPRVGLARILEDPGYVASSDIESSGGGSLAIGNERTIAEWRKGRMPIRMRAVMVHAMPEQVSAAAERSFLHDLQKYVETERPRLVLDCSMLRQMDGSAIHLLLSCLEEVMKRNGDAKLAALRPGAEATLHFAGVNRLFEVYATVADAVHSFERRPYRAAPALFDTGDLILEPERAVSSFANNRPERTL